MRIKVAMATSAIIIFLSILTFSSACQSMNGISRKAVLLGLEKTGQPRESTKVVVSEPTPGPEQLPSNDVPVFLETSAEGQLIALNISYDMLRRTLETLEEIHKDSNVFNVTSSSHGKNFSPHSNKIQWFYPRQRNTSKPVIIQSLTKSNEYVDLNYLKISDMNGTSEGQRGGLLNKTIALMGDEKPEAFFLRLFNASDSKGLNSSEAMAKAIATKLLQQPPNVQPRPLPPMVAIPPLTKSTINGDTLEGEEMDEDERIRLEWGGNCTVENWKSCYNITVYGMPTLVHPQFPNDRKKNIRTQLNCFDTNEAADFPWLCLRNGWTVNRCHILCMSKCNREYLQTRKWDFYVLHEGPCKTK